MLPTDCVVDKVNSCNVVSVSSLQSNIVSSDQNRNVVLKPTCFTITLSYQLNVWHRHLCHASHKTVVSVMKQCKINYSININDKYEFCDACQLGKSHALPFHISQTKTHRSLELIQTDLWEPAPITFNQSFRYYIHFIDYYSRFTYIYPLISNQRPYVFSNASKN